ncbi:hypothetical protein D3C71_755880 [compost metagenome]
MTIHDIMYLSILGTGAISLIILYSLLRKSAKKLPGGWKKSLPSRNFRLSVLFLMISLLIIFIGEMTAIQLGRHGIYNSFVISINWTLFTPFLFGFLFIHTSKIWKRSIYIVLYLILVGYLIRGGYYHPSCILQNTSVLLFSSICFLAALVHLTDLLVNPKSEHFKFQLKVTICLLIYNILGAITTAFWWSFLTKDQPYSNLIYYIHFYNIFLFYFSLALVFIIEILKLRRVL